MPPNSTWLAPLRPRPVMDTVIPPAPQPGLRPVRTGGGAAGAVGDGVVVVWLGGGPVCPDVGAGAAGPPEYGWKFPGWVVLPVAAVPPASVGRVPMAPFFVRAGLLGAGAAATCRGTATSAGDAVGETPAGANAAGDADAGDGSPAGVAAGEATSPGAAASGAGTPAAVGSRPNQLATATVMPETP